MSVTIDDLSYFYKPEIANQLIKVTDATNVPQRFKDDSLDLTIVQTIMIMMPMTT